MSSLDPLVSGPQPHGRPSAGDAATSAPSTLDRIKEQASFGHDAWVQRLAEMQALEVEFANELLATKDPKIALQLCNRWIGKRLDLLAEDSKAFAGFWMDLVMMTAVSLPPVTASDKKGNDA